MLCMLLVIIFPATCISYAVYLSTGAAVGVSVAVTAVVFTILGFLAGLLAMYLSITCKNTAHSPAKRYANTQPTVPAGPVYEDVAPASKEEIELESNEAYQSVGQ